MPQRDGAGPESPRTGDHSPHSASWNRSMLYITFQTQQAGLHFDIQTTCATQWLLQLGFHKAITQAWTLTYGRERYNVTLVQSVLICQDMGRPCSAVRGWLTTVMSKLQTPIFCYIQKLHFSLSIFTSCAAPFRQTVCLLTITVCLEQHEAGVGEKAFQNGWKGESVSQ